MDSDTTPPFPRVGAIVTFTCSAASMALRLPQQEPGEPLHCYVGKVTKVYGKAPVVAVTGDGDGTISNIRPGPLAKAGTYTATVTTAATHGGTFTVEDKMANPPYDGPEGSFAADDPKNPVGERWISLGGGYGIHGTIEPDSIGKSESLGCIRLHNTDVEIVYDLLTVGSEVVIQR